MRTPIILLTFFCLFAYCICKQAAANTNDVVYQATGDYQPFADNGMQQQQIPGFPNTPAQNYQGQVGTPPQVRTPGQAAQNNAGGYQPFAATDNQNPPAQNYQGQPGFAAPQVRTPAQATPNNAGGYQPFAPTGYQNPLAQNYQGQVGTAPQQVRTPAQATPNNAGGYQPFAATGNQSPPAQNYQGQVGTAPQQVRTPAQATPNNAGGYQPFAATGNQSPPAQNYQGQVGTAPQQVRTPAQATPNNAGGYQPFAATGNQSPPAQNYQGQVGTAPQQVRTPAQATPNNAGGYQPFAATGNQSPPAQNYQGRAGFNVPQMRTPGQATQNNAGGNQRFAPTGFQNSPAENYPAQGVYQPMTPPQTNAFGPAPIPNNAPWQTVPGQQQTPLARGDLKDRLNSIFGPPAPQPTASPRQPFPPPLTATRSPIQPSPTRAPAAVARVNSCDGNRECVKRNLCNNGKSNIYGRNIISLRKGDEDNGCHYLETCCEIPNIINEPVLPDVDQKFVTCGERNPHGVGFRIMNNIEHESEFGEFPWMVAILQHNRAEENYECGGAILAPTVVLTAAHCVDSFTPDQLLARAGEWDTRTRKELLPNQDSEVSEIIIHEDFQRRGLLNDVALLILAQPYKWRPNVRPICLPEANQKFDYTTCIASGWGKDDFGKNGVYQVILKKIEMSIVSPLRCQNNLRATSLGKQYRLHESFICAGGEEGKDTCKGDGGSPLVCLIEGETNRYSVLGLVSWGLKCGQKNVPGIYANVRHVRSWIDEKLQEKNIDSNHYTPYD